MRQSRTPKTTGSFNRSPVSKACLTFAVLLAGASAVHAGSGWGDSNGPNGGPIRVQTYYAHSPSGKRDVVPPEAVGYDALYPKHTGKALRKFIDPLPGIGQSANTLADGVTSKYIPKAAANKWVRPDGSVSNDDYYEIAVVQYKEKMHTDLAQETTLRGYVQLTKDTSKNPLTYPDGSPIMIQDADNTGLLWLDAAKTQPKMVQAYSVDKPHYLGPAIEAVRGTATRLKFYNLLPVGRYDASKGRNGDLFIPVDETLPGAGVGPDGVTRYTQNRSNVHLHGGDTPWISDGTPHQWIAPAGEKALLAKEMAAAGSPLKPQDAYLRGASAANVPDMPDPGDGAVTYYFPNLQSGRMMWYHDHSFGLTRLNVYVGQAAPYILKDTVQDNALQAIAGFPKDGETISLVIQDKTFVPDDIAVQDARWNTDTADRKLDGQNGNGKPLWGEAADLWYPHVYEVNQDPSNGVDGTNPVGRWDWGPYFWPVFPSLYNLPSGKVGDVTLTPEAWMDTPVVNGVAYPTLTVDPKAYRFKILNASNDRFWNLSMFVADSAVSTINVTNGGAGYDAASTTVTLVAKPGAGGSGATAEAVVVGGVVTAIRVTNAGTGYTKTPNIFIVDKNGNKTASASATLAVNTEVKMVPAVPASASGLAACQTDTAGNDIAPPYAPPCWPSNWPTDGRDGGVPDPTTAGPLFYQIGNEGGLLPQVAEVVAAPMQYEYNRRSVTVLNTLSSGLFLGNAERADVVVDFSNFAGQTLVIYNDSPAPVPAFDPRNDHWTGKPDESGVGSVETPRAGYGPNTRTVMQIKVADLPATTPLDVNTLKTQLPTIYSNTQEAPVVAQAQYAPAFNPAWTDAPQADGTKAFATIFTGSLQEPTFKFTPGTPAGAFKIAVDNPGAGYILAPAVTLTATAPDAPTVPATAQATLKINAVNVIDAGAGYLFAPTITFTSNGQGSGASAVAWLKVNTVTGLVGGSGYPANATVAGQEVKLMFSAPQNSSKGFDKAANTAYGYATTDANGSITGFTVAFAGNGYSSVPLLSPVPVDLTGTPIVGNYTYPSVPTVDGSIASIQMTPSDPNHPEFAGGGGYIDLRTVTMAISAPTGPGGRAARTAISGGVGDVTFTNTGKGYTVAPSISIGAPPVGGTQALATATSGGTSILVKNKAIQELFDPTYGRMNATLGIEIPFTSALTQTTIPLGYVDPVSEEFNDGETQIWKITHNGVDAHPVHFHLLNVQLINRVGWDGTIKAPKANEYGWKETIKMNPLEDILVAVRAKKPVLPGFGLPNSVRMRDPSQPKGVPTGFTQIDVKTGLPATVVNGEENYGWEYVWHCHILGHEENDFMRPVKFNAGEAVPAAPTNVTSTIAGNQITINWVDASVTEYQYQIHRTALFANGKAGVPTLAATLLANSTTFTETMPQPANAGDSWIYTITAVGANGTGSVEVPVVIPVGAPTNVAASVANNGRVTVKWTDNSINETRFKVAYSSDNGANWTTTYVNTANRAGANVAQSLQLPAGAFVAGSSYLINVTAELVYGGAAGVQNVTPSATAATTLNYIAPATAVTNLAAAVTRGVVTVNGVAATANQDIFDLTWTNAATPVGDVPVASYTVEWSTNNFATAPLGSRTGVSAVNQRLTLALNRGGALAPNPASYQFRVRGVNGIGSAVGVVPALTAANAGLNSAVLNQPTQ